MERESPLIYLFSLRQFIWEYTSGKGKSTYIFVFNEAIHLGIYKRKGKVHIYLFSLRQFIWEYISGKGKSTYIFVFN